MAKTNGKRLKTAGIIEVHMDYNDVFQNALNNTSTLSLPRSESDKTSLFGVINNLVLAARRADRVSLEPLRKLLESIMKIPSNNNNYRYMGVKVADLQTVIKALLCDERERILYEFIDYKYDELLQYLEICKRAWQAEYKKSSVPIKPSVANANANVKKKPIPCKFEELTERLIVKDIDVAEWIISNRSECTTVQVSMAENVLRDRKR